MASVVRVLFPARSRARSTRRSSSREMLSPGFERANLRALLAVRCLSAAAEGLDYVRRCGELPTKGLLGAQVMLMTESERVVEVARNWSACWPGGGRERNAHLPGGRSPRMGGGFWAHGRVGASGSVNDQAVVGDLGFDPFGDFHKRATARSPRVKVGTEKVRRVAEAAVERVLAARFSVPDRAAQMTVPRCRVCGASLEGCHSAAGTRALLRWPRWTCTSATGRSEPPSVIRERGHIKPSPRRAINR